MDKLLAAALSAVVRTPIAAHNNHSGTPNQSDLVELDPEVFHQIHISQGPVHSTSTQSTSKPTSGKPEYIIINVKTLTGKSILLRCDPNVDTIRDIKEKIEIVEKIPPVQQTLLHLGVQLKDSQTLGFYQVKNKSTLYLTVAAAAAAPLPPIIYLPSNLRAPEYDFDYTNYPPDLEAFHRRGVLHYKRPIGWQKIALNVDRYGADKSWLGPKDGKRKFPGEIVPGEWPVAYHGTGLHNARSIAQEGFLLSKGSRFAFGHGVYTTPDIDVAEMYAIRFWHHGDSYKVVIQNRVNPETVEQVRVRDSMGTKKYFISPEDGVRPYALCVKKLGDYDGGRRGNVSHYDGNGRGTGKNKHRHFIPDSCLCM